MKAKLKNPLISFLLTYVILLTAFMLHGLYPFGDKQIMIIDSWHQYYPILKHLHFCLQNGQSLFYTFNSGAGSNFLVMLGYYALSPLYLLSIFVSSEYLREFMAYITIFKVSLAAATFTYYLESNYQQRNLFSLLFGLSFAFSGYFMAYYWNIMWLDVAMIMPLTILGLERLISKKSPWLYTFSLAYAIFANYYAAYFLCLFIFFYSFLYLFLAEQLQLKAKFLSIIRVAIFSLLAIMLTAISLLPIVEGMDYAYALASKNPTELELYYPVFDLLAQFTPFIATESLEGLPNISLMAFALLFVLLYFVNPKINLRAKLGNAVLIVFLLLAMIVNYLDFFWHAFHFPNQVPHRFTFVLIFLLLTLAYQAFINLQYIGHKQLLAVSAAIISFLIIAQKLNDDSNYQYSVLAAVIVLAIYALVFYYYQQSVEKRRIISRLILALVVTEALAVSFFAISSNRLSTRSSYPKNGEEMADALAYISEYDNGFYRLERSSTYTANDPLLYNYRGITQFASTANAGFNEYTEALGLSATPSANSYRYFPNTPIANGLLTLKYLLEDENYALQTNLYSQLYQNNAIRVLENKYPFPLAFAVQPELEDFVAVESSAFANQERILQLMTSLETEIFTYLSEDDIVVKPNNIQDIDLKGNSYHYSNINASQVASAELEVIFPKTGQAFAYIKNSDKKANLKFRTRNKDYDPRKGIVVDLGLVEAGEKAEFEISLKAQKSGYFDFEVVYFEESTFSEYYQLIKSEALELTSFDNTKIEGQINLNSAKKLYFAIPYDKGWQLTLDGKTQQLETIDRDIILVNLPPGQHQLSLNYQPLSLKKGAFASVVALIILLIIAFISKKSKKDSIKSLLVAASNQAANGELEQKLSSLEAEESSSE